MTSSGSRGRTRSRSCSRCSRRPSTSRRNTSGSRRSPGCTRRRSERWPKCTTWELPGALRPARRSQRRGPCSPTAGRSCGRRSGGSRFFARAAFSRGGVGLLTTPGRWPATSRRTIAIRPRRILGWSRSSWMGRCTAPTGASRRPGGVPHGLPGRRGSGSTRLGSSSSPSIRRTRSEPSSGSAPSSRGTGRCRSTSSRREALVMIECNPRPTDGVLLMTPEELERGLLGPEEETPSFRPAGGATRLRGPRSDLPRADQGAAPVNPRSGEAPRDGSRVAGRNA